MSRPALTSEIVLGKVAASMQLVLLVTVIGLGKLALGLEGVFPAKYLLGSRISAWRAWGSSRAQRWRSPPSSSPSLTWHSIALTPAHRALLHLQNGRRRPG